LITEIQGKQLDFHQLLKHSILPKIVIKDDTILYANKACLQMLKLEKQEEVLNQSIQKFLHPDFYHFCKKGLEEILTKKSHFEQAEIKVIDANGRIMDVEVTIGGYFIEGETLAQIILQDITEKKETQMLLMQSEKLSIMGELAAGIVHEIRNPLTILKGFLELLESDTTQKGKEYIAIMTNELERIELMANDLLYFSKPHKQNIKLNNLVELIDDVISLLDNSAFKKHILINFYYETRDIFLKCDELQLKQAFINLIKNAIEATPNKGVINIRIEKNENVIVTISDTGCGMTKKQLDHLGTSFFTTKKDGTGLGLLVTYNIIKNQHGCIHVKSEEGIGTTFIIRFPLV
jgi:two-component system, sporulation sensor kinase A